MTTRKQKALLALSSLIITLLLIEGAARLAGFIYTVYRTKNRQTSTQTDKPIIKILCLGDSFTLGLGAGYGDDYPAQLERLLNEKYSNKKFIVYNRGVCGNNSSMVLKSLAHNINTDNPNLVLLLIGSNDETVLEGSSYYLFKSPGIGKIAAFSLRLNMFCSKLKIYKFIKILALNLKNKFSPVVELADTKVQTKPDYSVTRITSVYKNAGSDKREIYLKEVKSLCIDRKFNDAENMLLAIPGGVDLKSRNEGLFLSDIYYVEGKYDLAIGILKEYLKDNPRDAEAIFDLGRNYYLQVMNYPAIEKENFPQAVELFNRSLSCIDANALLLKIENYSYLARIYFAEGKNVLAEEMLDQVLKAEPNNQFARQLKRGIRESSMSEREREIFARLFFYNLGQIINVCQTYNLKIILLNYPIGDGEGIRGKIAGQYKVPFVDVGLGFTRALSKYKQSDLFSPDRSHPNAKGYKLMAEIIFQGLNSEKIGAF